MKIIKKEIVIEASVAKSRQISAPECIAVVDAGGNVLAFARVEGAAVLATGRLFRLGAVAARPESSDPAT